MVGLCPIVEDAARTAGSPGEKKHGSAAAREVCGSISPGSCIPGGREVPREGGLQVTNTRHCLEKGGRKSNMVERFSSW